MQSPAVAHNTCALFARLVDGYPHLDSGQVIFISFARRNDFGEDRACPAPVHPHIVQIRRDRLFEMWVLVEFRVGLHDGMAHTRGGRRVAKGGVMMGEDEEEKEEKEEEEEEEEEDEEDEQAHTISLSLSLIIFTYTSLPLSPLSLTLRRMVFQRDGVILARNSRGGSHQQAVLSKGKAPDCDIAPVIQVLLNVHNPFMGTPHLPPGPSCCLPWRFGDAL